MMDREAFTLYTKYREQINKLSDEQAGQLMKAIFDYQATGEEEIKDAEVEMLWSIMKQQNILDDEERERKEFKEMGIL